MSTLSINKLLPWATFGLTLVLYAPVLSWLWNEWFTNPFYSHGPLVLLVALFIVWRRGGGYTVRPANWGLALAGAGLAVYGGSVAWSDRLVGILSLFPFLLGLVAYFWGWDPVRRLTFPMLFALFMIPLPFTVLERATLGLQILATSAAAIASRAVGIHVTQTGGQLELLTSTLVVGAQCSGMRSVVTLLALAVLMAFTLKGTLRAKLGLVALAIPLAVMANILRITSLVWVVANLGDEAGLSFYHDWSSPVFFLIALGLLILVSWSVGCREIRSDL